MRIVDVLDKKAIIPDLKSTDKKGVLQELSRPISELINVTQEDLMDVLIERERLGSTGIGNGIGIPHGKMKNLDKLALSLGISRQGIDFESIDGRPTHLFFLLITPEKSTGIHLKLLAHISRILRNEMFKQKLMKAHTADELYRIIDDLDDIL
ncbi:MAG: PTS system, nitrogen regulatory IIA component [Candidatus Magnetoglobus multicellularis str. Araruama]|uniref:PTS system, nitrogen regulatory IIA component n=1 Tax=Candidatus Magnetoglobus multicellularis str. Araruama TaxID=890399 RepID=A0A1V1P170_9BACT|nr:MAG: PTS system, nitrogen regulatory IIA component [Candidatus Magnetoglobus multicellularis str. Araruama]